MSVETVKPEAVIRLYFCTPCILTVEEYEQLQKEVLSHAIARDTSVGDRVLAQLLTEHYSRYFEAKAQNAPRDDPMAIAVGRLEVP